VCHTEEHIDKAYCALYHKGQIIMYKETADNNGEYTTEMLNDMMNDSELRYCTWEEIGLPFDFSCEAYKAYNGDLAHMSNSELKAHYTINGKHEQRVYFHSHVLDKLPNDFCATTYKSLNPDISGFSDDWVRMHYVRHGIDEGRIYK
jgi:hypothetical protein